MAKVVKDGTRVLCGGCMKHIFDLELEAPNARHATFKAYAKGKYKYCAKCGAFVEMAHLVADAMHVGILK